MSIARSKPITSTEVRDGLLLRGLDGANPLGFLAALGTLQTISIVNPLLPIMMSWSDDSFGCRPSIHGFVGDLTSLSDQIACHLNCPFHTDEMPTTNECPRLNISKQPVEGSERPKTNSRNRG